MEPWPDLEPYSGRIELKRSSVNLFYYDTGGDGLPVCVLVHGLADEADTWRHIVRPLSATHRVIVPDLPGFGRSGKPRRRYTVPWLCGVLGEFLDTLSVKDALLCGSSLGGILCQKISLDRPDLVGRLVLADGVLLTAPQKISLSLLLFLTPFVGESLYTRLRKDPDGAYQTLIPYYHDLGGMPGKDREFLHKRVNERVWDDGQKYAFFSVLRNMGPWLRKRQKSIRRILPESLVPTLILWGEDDRIMPADSGRVLDRLQEHSVFKTIREAGHLPHQEQPERFLALLREFLQNDS